MKSTKPKNVSGRSETPKIRRRKDRSTKDTTVNFRAGQTQPDEKSGPSNSGPDPFFEKLPSLVKDIVRQIFEKARSGELKLNPSSLKQLLEVSNRFGVGSDTWRKARVLKTDLPGLIGISRQKIFNRIEKHGDFPEVPPGGIEVSAVFGFIPALWEKLSKLRSQVAALDSKLAARDRELNEVEKEKLRELKLRNDQTEAQLINVHEVAEAGAEMLSRFREKAETAFDTFRRKAKLTDAQAAKLDELSINLFSGFAEALEKLAEAE